MHAQLSNRTRSLKVYPGSDIVVAITLAKWEKLEPNEINFSQVLCQKVVSLPARDNFCWLLISFTNSLNPDQARQNADLI